MGHKAVRPKVQLEDLFIFVGLDTSVIVDLLRSPQAKKFFHDKIYLFEQNLLFTHRICIAESLGLLIGKDRIDKNEARNKIKELVEEFKIRILELEEHEEDQKYIFSVGKKYGWQGDEIINDAIIITSFWRKGMNMIIVRDAVFEKVCKELKMNVLSFPLF